MKYVTYFLTALVVVFALLGFLCAPKSATETDFLLDTYISVTAYGKNAKKAAEQAVLCVSELDKKLSAFRKDSDVYRINTAKANTEVSVSTECFELILRAKELSEKTDGAFDVAIKPIMDVWGFGKKNKVPDDSALLNALSLVDYNSIILNEEAQTVTLTKDGMAIDLGAIAKGYCADMAAKVLKNNGIENAYLDFGGNVVTMGKRPLGLIDRIKYGARERDFVVGIQNPQATRGEVITTHTAEGEYVAIVTSGGYERYFEEEGKRYHHIVSPFTGKQPENGILSVTVIGASSEIADALSTAFFVSGTRLAKRTDNGLYQKAIFVMDTGEIQTIYPQGEK